MRNRILIGLVLLLLVWAQGGRANADFSYHVVMDTAGLIGHPAGPFSLDLQFIDGDGLSNNTVMLSGFSFGTGAAIGAPSLTGGASGDLSSSVTLTDSSFFNELIQGVDPGNSLSFDLLTTANFAGGTPDGFSVALLDSTGSELPTFSSSFAFLTIDLAGGPPTVSSFSSDPGQLPVAGGPGINLAAPTVTLVSAGITPEPSTLLYMGSGLIAMLSILRLRRTARLS